MMARGGVTTAMDHHYVFPQGSGDLSGAIIRAAREMGVRFTLARGSMDRGESDGGLPPDFAVETLEGRARRHRGDRRHAPRRLLRRDDPDRRRALLALLRLHRTACAQGAELARRKGVRLHTHGSETVEEEKFCHELFGMGPTDYFESTGWLGEDVWMAHCVHMNDSDIAAFARTGTGVAHCPSSNARLAAGIARVPDMLAAGVPVGLGVDGTASNESGELHTELRNALLINRLGAHREAALNARQALRLGTYGGAQVLGRAGEIGSLEAGKLADLVLWKLDTLAHASIADPVTALVFGAAAPVTALPRQRPASRRGRPPAHGRRGRHRPLDPRGGAAPGRDRRAGLSPLSVSGREGRLPAGDRGPRRGPQAAVSGAHVTVRPGDGTAATAPDRNDLTARSTCPRTRRIQIQARSFPAAGVVGPGPLGADAHGGPAPGVVRVPAGVAGRGEPDPGLVRAGGEIRGGARRGRAGRVRAVQLGEVVRSKTKGSSMAWVAPSCPSRAWERQANS